MRKLLPVLLLGCTAMAAQTATLAADNGVYVGAGITKSQVDDILGTPADIDDTAFKIIGGVRPIDLFAVEANYLDLGKEDRSFGLGTARADAKAFAAYAVGFLPLPVPFLDVYGKVGLARWDLKGDSGLNNLARFSDHGTDFAWGAGAQVRFGSLAARLEFDRFDIDNTDGVKAYTLGATWTFL